MTTIRFRRVKLWADVVLGLHLALLPLRSEADAPLITTQPLSQSVAVGGTVTLAPSVSSTAPLGYQWWKDGSLLLGATSSSLIFTNAQVTNSGAYDLVATNTSGTAVSLPALVQVGEPDLFAWGDGKSGALGNGSYTNVYAPLNTFSNVVILAAGAGFTLFVDGHRNLWATGTNASGQLGIGSAATATNLPVLVATNVVAVAAGFQHSLFVKADSSLWAMGDNSLGQLGVTTNVPATNQPVYVATNVVAVSAGWQHSLFLKTDGSVWAMGQNYYLQLGNGTEVGFTNQPQLIAGDAAAISAGGFHSLLITAGGMLFGAGNNEDGELGLGTGILLTNYPAPIAANVISAAGGGQHSLFVKSDGTMWCMGTNSYGQLGLNDLLTGSAVLPLQVTTNVVRVSAGLNHSLFLKADGSVWGMGNDASGQLGDDGNDYNDKLLGVPDTYAVNISPMPVVALGLLCGSLRSGPAANHSLCTGFELPIPPAVAIYGGGNLPAGYPFELTTGVAGTGPLTCQWWRDGVLLVGQTGFILTVSSAQVADSGAYYAVVTSPLGIAVSTPVLVTVGSPVLAGWGNNLYGQLASGTSGYSTNGAVLTTNRAVLGAAGQGSTLFIGNAGGALWSAGLNTDGQLGNGTLVNTNNPQIIASNNVVAVAAGQFFSLYIDNQDTLWGVGDNSYGELGPATGTTGTNPPVPVATNAVIVAAGFQHSLFVRNDGTLWGLGFNEDGELGNGSVLSTNQPVWSASNVVAAAAGAYHSLFIKVNGSLWGMGANSAGQLGIGPGVAATNLPALVATNVIAVAAGFQHTLFIKGDNTLWAMGDNTYGQLGLGSQITGTNLPACVASNVIAVTAGYQHSMFETGDGTLWVMGNNANGQLGDGTFTTSYVPESILPGFTLAALASGPAATHTVVVGVAQPPTVTQPTNQMAGVGGMLSFSTSATGFGQFNYQWFKNGALLAGATNQTLIITNALLSHSGFYYVAVTNSVGVGISLPVKAVVGTAALLACGDNGQAELGLGTNNPNILKTFTGTTNAALVASAGNYFTVFIDAQGVLWGVGGNTSGQLGLGTNFPYSSPATVIASNVIAAAAGMNTILYLKSDATLWGVGNNGYYEFGLTAPLMTNRPALLSTFPGKPVAVAVGGSHSLVLRNDGTLWGAGNNGSGQLGLGAASYLTSWTEITNGVVAIAAGWFHSLFLKADGTLWTMGDNAHGEMGDGTIVNRTSPIYVTNHVTALAGGFDDTLFARSDGTLWGLGNNESGQLGNGTYTDTNRPVMVDGSVATVTAGQSQVLYLKTDGTLWGTGYNGNGQLGLGPNLNITNRPAPILAGVPVAGVFSGATAIHTLLVAPPAPPVITLQPTNQTLPPGASATFAVAAYGFAPLAYQWQFKATNINNATTASLALPALTATTAGAYQAVVSNPGGSATSSTAVLTVGVVPGISSITLLTSHSVKILCASNSLTIPGRLLATTNLLVPLNNWLTLTNLPAGPVGPVQYLDPGTTNYPSRFYRSVWP